jgi:hypothetical protein
MTGEARESQSAQEWETWLALPWAMVLEEAQVSWWALELAAQSAWAKAVGKASLWAEGQAFVSVPGCLSY